MSDGLEFPVPRLQSCQLRNHDPDLLRFGTGFRDNIWVILSEMDNFPFPRINSAYESTHYLKGWDEQRNQMYLSPFFNDRYLYDLNKLITLNPRPSWSRPTTTQTKEVELTAEELCSRAIPVFGYEVLNRHNNDKYNRNQWLFELKCAHCFAPDAQFVSAFDEFTRGKASCRPDDWTRNFPSGNDIRRCSDLVDVLICQICGTVNKVMCNMNIAPILRGKRPTGMWIEATASFNNVFKQRDLVLGSLSNTLSPPLINLILDFNHPFKREFEPGSNEAATVENLSGRHSWLHIHNDCIECICRDSLIITTGEEVLDLTGRIKVISIANSGKAKMVARLKNRGCGDARLFYYPDPLSKRPGFVSCIYLVAVFGSTWECWAENDEDFHREEYLR